MTNLRIARVWPLILSVLAFWGIARILPDFYYDFLFWSDGVGATGWISDRDCGQDQWASLLLLRLLREGHYIWWART